MAKPKKRKKAIPAKGRSASGKKKFQLWKSTQERLISAAKQAQKMAHCPYSSYPVGSAVLTSAGRIFAGCNVENASFGLSICAERSAIFAAVSHGQKRIRAIAVVARSARPCGACRQVMLEFADPSAVILSVDWDPIHKKQKVMKMRVSEAIPKPFNPLEAGL